MTRHTLLLITLLAATLTASAQHVSQHRASFIDVPVRQAALAVTKDTVLLSAIKSVHSCVKSPAVAPPPNPMRIPHHYLTGSNGPTNPAEAAATAVYGDFERRITAGMNLYVATGSHEEAQCALDQLDAWGKAGALMAYDPKEKDNTQSWFQAEWTLCSSGTTMSVLVNDSKLDLNEQKRVTLWLDQAAHRLIGFEKPGETGNNHHYWRALAATSIGVVASDDALFQFGVNTYKQAIAQIDKNGAFPLEMQRHENAMHYQAFALQPVITIAEFATRQGTNLYDYTANGHTLKDALVFLGKAIDDPAIIKQYTDDEQKRDIGSGSLAASLFFTARYGTGGMGTLVTKELAKPASETRIGGNIYLLTAK